MAVAAAFIIGQSDFKRMLAYSSVEHMGILAFGMGLGAAPAALLHAVNHSLTKGMLFLTAGNMLAVGKTKAVAETRGLLRALPISGALWFAGFLAVTGTPPFGPFVSELWILKSALASGRGLLAGLYLLGLAAAFIGIAAAAENVPGEPSEKFKSAPPENDPWRLAPPLILGLCVLILGLWVPEGLRRTLTAAAACLGAK